jgi:hypothetical protein
MPSKGILNACKTPLTGHLKAFAMDFKRPLKDHYKNISGPFKVV